jgi:hypothetical protein
MTLTTEILLWMAAAIFWALSGMAIVRYYLTDAELAGNNPGGGFKYMYFAQVFAGFAAFVLVQASDTRESASTAIAQETAALRALVMVANASGMDGDGRIASAVKGYGEAVGRLSGDDRNFPSVLGANCGKTDKMVLPNTDHSALARICITCRHGVSGV